MVCTKCKEDKPEEQFNWRFKDKGIKQKYCKICQSNYTKNHYRKNPEPYKKRAVVGRQTKILKYREFIWEYLLKHPCVDCGETDPVVLEFDHQEDKKFCISMVTDFSLKSIIEEVDKCVVRCANCHRKKTGVEFGYWRTIWGDRLVVD